MATRTLTGTTAQNSLRLYVTALLRMKAPITYQMDDNYPAKPEYNKPDHL